MIPKPTEDTITRLLAEELEKHGVKTEVLPSIPTPQGIRKPDIWCVNSGAYPVEAKFRERDLINAVAKVQNDYIRWYDVLGVKGGFALLYPEELAKQLPPQVIAELAYKVKFKAVAMFPPKDVRKSFTVYEGNLAEIAKIIAEHVLTPPEYVEPSTDYIIKALRDSAMCITTTLRYLSGGDLEDVFGGKEVFKNILQYEERRYPIESLRLASAYLLINQLLFYHILSRRRPEDFPEIDAEQIKRPSDLNKYFRSVLNVNYRTVFSYDVASRIPPEFTDQIRAVISVIKGLAPEKVGGDLLGTIFHDLVPFEVRKSVAAFYTNVLAAELLAWLSIDEYDAKVADFAVGSGGLLVAAYRRKRHLLESKRRFKTEDHRRFVEEELLGVDVMPFAANVAACHLALQSPEYFTNRVAVAIWDSTELDPGRRIPSIASLKFVLKGQRSLELFAEPEAEGKGVVSLTGEAPEEIKLQKYDVVIMNPPFTRQERIPKEYKATLNDRFKDYKTYLHGQLGYFGYFVLLADKFLKEDGKMALVLPATVLRIKSCEGIRKLWAERYHVEHIITTWHRSAFSESVRFREILLVAKRCQPAEDAKTVVTVLKKLPESPSEARRMAEEIRLSTVNWEDDRMSVRIHDYSKFRADTSNWFKYIAVSNLSLIDLYEELFSKWTFIPLSSLARIIRGYELRGGIIAKLIINARKERAFKSSDIWILSNLDETNRCLTFGHRAVSGVMFKVPLSAVKRTLRRAAGVESIDATPELDFIVVKAWDRDTFSRFVATIDVGLSNELLKSIERDVENRLGNFFVIRRLDLSAPHTHTLAFYSSVTASPTKLLWSLKLSDEHAKLLALYFNSILNLIQTLLLRSETRGAFIELSEYILSSFLVPDVRKLSREAKACLLSVFDRVKDVKLPSILEQLKSKHSARRLIDETWLKVLGCKRDTTKFLDKLYESLAEEITILRKMMAEKQNTGS